jgi:hypothetical protein
MDFNEFTERYRGTINPATKKAWTVAQMTDDSKVPSGTVSEWINFWYSVQSEMVKASNKMPSNSELVARWNALHPIPPGPPVFDGVADAIAEGADKLATRMKPAIRDIVLEYLKELFPEKFQ